MESVDRKVKAESFVRKYSFNVASDLPENELAQFLMENQSLEILQEDRRRDGGMPEFNRWLCAETPDRFASPVHRHPWSFGCEELISS